MPIYTFKEIPKTVINNYPEIVLWNLACFHTGAKGAHTPEAEALKKETILTIEKNENHFWVGDGDMNNNETKDSVGSIYDEIYHGYQQTDMNEDILSPIAHKGLVGGRGNHSNRSVRYNYQDPERELYKRLRMDYFEDQLLMNLNCGPTYTIFMRHGSGSVKDEYINRWLMDMTKLAEADLYLTAHIHKAHYCYDQVWTADHIHRHDIVKNRTFVSAGHALDYIGYPARDGLKRRPMGFAKVHLSTNRTRKFITVSMDIVQ